jgi:hypothetical protein
MVVSLEWLVKVMVILVVLEVDVFRTQAWKHVAVSNCAFVRTIPETNTESGVKPNEDRLFWKSG